LFIKLFIKIISLVDTVLKYVDVVKENFVPFVGDKNKLQKMVQMAWTFVNDRYVNV